MKELFRERDYTRIGYCQSILEDAGIATVVRNKDLVGSVTEVPIPDFFPALCVLNDEDYEPALEILKERMRSDAQNADTVWACENCSEENPGNFDVCWNCENSKSGDQPEPATAPPISGS